MQHIFKLIYVKKYRYAKLKAWKTETALFFLLCEKETSNSACLAFIAAKAMVNKN